MGNICRSPTAEGIFRHLVNTEGLSDQFNIDSAGTHSYHVGNSPDRRSQAMARQRGLDISTLRARQFVREDFDQFAYVIAMDHENKANMEAMKSKNSEQSVHLMLEYASSYPGHHNGMRIR